jgi:DNA-binding FrmR family transcriptional regulator
MAASVAISGDVKDDMVARLRRIEGQIRGLQRMLAEDRDCTEIAQQMGAARSALERAYMQLVAAGLEHCLRRDLAGDPAAKSTLRQVTRAFVTQR